jgi:hypothetical protein
MVVDVDVRLKLEDVRTKSAYVSQTVRTWKPWNTHAENFGVPYVRPVDEGAKE